MAPLGEQVSFTCSGVGGTTSTIRWMITILDVVPDNLAEVGIFPPPIAQPLISTVLINSMESNNGTTLNFYITIHFKKKKKKKKKSGRKKRGQIYIFKPL